jgi:pyridoxine 5'-phosphate synthase PdxJ
MAAPQFAAISVGHALTAAALRLGFPAAVEPHRRALRRVTLAAD